MSDQVITEAPDADFSGIIVRNVEIATSGGVMSRLGLCLGELAITDGTAESAKFLVITHLPTGLSLNATGARFRHLKNAVDALVEIHRIFPSAAELVSLDTKARLDLGKAVRLIVSACGGEPEIAADPAFTHKAGSVKPLNGYSGWVRP